MQDPSVNKWGFTPITPDPSTEVSASTATNKWGFKPVSGSGEILDNPTQVTQNFGTYNPIEPTANHQAGDTNFSADQGQAVHLPPGNWQVVKAYNQASPQGAPGDYADNSGWGNDVWVKDQQTGQMLHFLHLAGVNAQPGENLGAGAMVGTTGSSGNATGPNLGLEYYDEKGQLNDIMRSPYATYLPVTGQGLQ